MKTAAVQVSSARVLLEGDLAIPDVAHGMVLFAHGSGSSRRSPRNRFVASVLQRAGIATLLFDLLTAEEEEEERLTRHLRFDIGRLAERLIGATRWLRTQPEARGLDLGYFGASTGAAAALVAAANEPDAIGAVVSRGGRPDLAGAALPLVRAATLFIVGGDDGAVLTMNRMALDRMYTQKQLVVVPGAGHLFEEPGALEQVAEIAAAWFEAHLGTGLRAGLGRGATWHA